jgi:DNA-binding GntR family transcriptional regulator
VDISTLPAPKLTSPRNTSSDLRDHLRRLIMENLIPAGTVLKQAEIARLFGVSRTPLREAFRMLQEEGLIDADLNQRPRVRGLDMDDLDQLYAARITLESLGCQVSTGRLNADEKQHAQKLLESMERTRAAGDMGSWMDHHRAFLLAVMPRLGSTVIRTVVSYAERSERYLRLFQVWRPQSFAGALHEHQLILDAVSGDDPRPAVELMARHLSHTALAVMEDLAGTQGGDAIRAALNMTTRLSHARTRHP